MHSIAALAAATIAFFSLSLVFPALLAWTRGEWAVLEVFLVLGVAYGFLSGVTIMALSPKLRRLNRSGVFVASVGMWVTLSLVASLPFVLVEGQSLVASLFEAVSAAVTLGVTAKPVADISATMALYRGLVAWQGGLLTLLMAVYVLGRYEVGGTPNLHLRYVLHSFEDGDPRLLQTFFEVFVPYMAITLVCMAALVVARVTPMDSVNVAINIVATNGFLPVQTGATILNNLAGEIIVMVFMLLGATSIIWQRSLITRRWAHAMEQREAATFFMFVGAVALLAVVAALGDRTNGLSLGGAILNSVFDTVSVMTTTGITHHQRFGIGLPFELVLAVALVGGSAYSTAGGLRVFRLSLMLHHASNEIRGLVYPHVVLPGSVSSSPEILRQSKAVWSASFLGLLTLVVSAIVFSLYGISLAKVLGLAVGTFSSTGNLVTQALDSPPDGLLAWIAFFALAARIELLVVLAAIQRGKW